MFDSTLIFCVLLVRILCTGILHASLREHFAKANGCLKISFLWVHVKIEPNDAVVFAIFLSAGQAEKSISVSCCVVLLEGMCGRFCWIINVFQDLLHREYFDHVLLELLHFLLRGGVDESCGYIFVFRRLFCDSFLMRCCCCFQVWWSLFVLFQVCLLLLWLALCMLRLVLCVASTCTSTF